MKVMTVVGTRPEIIKLSQVIGELEESVDHVLVHTGQNYDYELNQIFFDQLRIKKPNYFLESVGSSVAETIGNILKATDNILEKERPDAILVLGDTNSCLCVISAKRRKIPIFHMEAGNRCFDLNVPEEINRKIVDHTSDVNMVYTEHARRYLINEGINPHLIIKTGSPMLEVLNSYKEDFEKSEILKKLNLVKGKYFVISAHREENVDNDQRLSELVNTLNSLSKEYDYPIIFSVHPRTRNRIKKLDKFDFDKNIILMRPLGFIEYINIQKNAACVISDSGTITEESSILSFPSITIRETHERPEGMDEGTLIMSSIEADNLLRNIKVVMKHFDRLRPFKLVEDYNSQNVSKKVVRVILSYTEYINKYVWRK